MKESKESKDVVLIDYNGNPNGVIPNPPLELQTDAPFANIINKFDRDTGNPKGWIVTRIKKEPVSSPNLIKHYREYLIFVNLDVDNPQKLQVSFKTMVADMTDESWSSSSALPGPFGNAIGINKFDNYVDAGDWKIFGRIY